jgi:hypothetical protein
MKLGAERWRPGWGSIVRSGVKARTWLLAAVAIGAAAVLLAACSPGAEFPSVLDSPQPRADKPMSPDQVKEVTNSLISDRDHLSAGAQPAAQVSAPAGRRAAAPPDATGSTQSAGVAARP